MIGERLKADVCMELASSPPGPSIASLPSRIMANLTPNGGGGGGAPMAPNGPIHITSYNRSIHTNYEGRRLVKCVCARDGSYGAPTRTIASWSEAWM